MLAILSTHPIQYQVPVWRALAARGRVPFRVFYLSDQGLAARHDPGFGRTVSWDIDLLGGYDHAFLDAAVGEPQGSFGWLRLRENLAARLARQGVDTLWIQGWQVRAYWQAAWQARAAGMALWLRGETNLRSTGRSRFGWAKRPLLNAFLRRFDQLLYIGEANRQFYLARGISAARLAPAPYCVENARFAADAAAARSDRAALRRRWGIAEDAFCLLFVGKLAPKKRPSDLVAAVAALGGRAGGRPLHVLFVGSGELAGAVRQGCRVVHDDDDAVGHSATIGPGDGRPAASFAGFLNQSRIAEAYVAADCLVLPSDAGETWGLVVNEAMACGLPAIVSDAVGCSDDLVRPIRPDLCFALGDVPALARSIEACVGDPPPPERLRQVIDRYDVLRTVETVEALYARRQAGG